MSSMTVLATQASGWWDIAALTSFIVSAVFSSVTAFLASSLRVIVCERATEYFSAIL